MVGTWCVSGGDGVVVGGGVVVWCGWYCRGVVVVVVVAVTATVATMEWSGCSSSLLIYGTTDHMDATEISALCLRPWASGAFAFAS